ncbi:MAG TPA: response regulator [Gemmataceae bacterium]|nr:response regulator [Gemmataceae bacterium]
MTTQTPRPLLLLVDDSPEIAIVVQRLARGAEYDVVVSPDVPDAWSCLSAKKAHLVLLDLNLPGENGAVLCRRLRGTAELSEVPVAVFSHWDRTEDILAGLAAGADFVVSKELLCRPDEWRIRIRELLTSLDRRTGELSLSLPGVSELSLAVERRHEAINRALRVPPLRSLNRELVDTLLERAAVKAAWRHAHVWLLPDDRGVLRESVAKIEPQQLLDFAAAVAEQLWCVAGSAASEAFADAVRATLTGKADPVEP